MILFDWKRVRQATAPSSKKLVDLIEWLAIGRPLPKNRWSQEYRWQDKDFSGSSFLINPMNLVRDRYQYTFRECAEYIALASLRSYADYRAIRRRELPLILSPLPLEKLEANRLLIVRDNQITFKYEIRSYDK